MRTVVVESLDAPLSRGVLTFGEALLTFKPASSPHPGASLGPSASLQCAAVGGAELNTACALSRITTDVPDVAASGCYTGVDWVSVLPGGALGKMVLSAASAAGVGVGAVKVVEGADIGTLHVVGGGDPRPHYQRHRGAFCTTAAVGVFDWDAILEDKYQWMHLTGITPLLGPGPRAAWEEAITAAASHGVKVSVDLNHRPALGTIQALWAIVEPLLPCITMLMLSERTLMDLNTHIGLVQVPTEAPIPLTCDPDAEPDALCAIMEHLRLQWGVPLLCCSFKRAVGGSGVNTNNTLKQGGNRRWSVVACGDHGGLVTTKDVPVLHQPIEALGGGDAWMAGFIHRCLEGNLQVKVTADGALGRGARSLLLEACRRGDLLAALQQETRGDQSDVAWGQLRDMEAAWPLSNEACAGGAGLVGKPVNLLRKDVAAGVVQSWVGRTKVVLATLAQFKIVPVVAVPEVDMAVPLARALRAGGLGIIELVFRTPAAEAALAAVAQANIPDLLVGAGTVLSTEQCQRAIDAGADFIVSPGLNPAVVRFCKDRGMPIIPGVATPTEVEAAMALGLTCLKFFPAQLLGGVPFLKAMSAPYPHIRWMPTGGVKMETLNEFLALPSVVAAGGTWMVPKDALAERDYNRVKELARLAKEAAAPAPSPPYPTLGHTPPPSSKRARVSSTVSGGTH